MSATQESSDETASSTADTESTDDTGIPGGGDPNFPESESIAVNFIDLMAAGQYESARELLCDDGKIMFPDGQSLADDFFSFLEAATVADSETVDVYVDPDDPDRDVVESTSRPTRAVCA